MNPLHPAVAQRAQNRCEYCRAPATAFNFAFEVEHITPLASGGSNTTENLALSCRSCNAFKAARQTGTDPQTQAIVLLFHPRQQTWEEHFRFNPQDHSLIGATPVGRATVALMQFNSPEQRTARQMWLRLDLFP